MSETRSRQPASDTRPTRRSLVELTAAASRALDDDLSVTPCPTATSPHDTPRLEHAAKTASPMTVAGQATAPICVAAPEPRSRDLLDSGSTSEMVVKIAQDYQDIALNNIKASTNAALDFAKRLAENRVPTDERSRNHGGASLNNFLTVLEGAAAEIHAEALELMKANVITTLEYARELAGTTTAADFVELSGTQARKQCQLILKQASALKSLTQTIAKSRTD